MGQAMDVEWSMGASARRGPRVPAFAEQWFDLPAGSFPFASRFLRMGTDSGNCQLHCIDEGRGPVLFMLHGNPTWSYQFRHLVRSLRSSYRCIALDLPGYGLSTAPPGFSFRPRDIASLVAQAMRQLDLRDATLVAHDWGGPIGLAAMAEEKGRIARIVFGNTWAWPVDGDSHFEWYSNFLGGPVGHLLNTEFLALVNVVMPVAMRRRSLTSSELAAYRAPFADKARRTPLHVLSAELTRAVDWLADVEREADGYHGPALFLWPEGDLAFRRRELERWCRLWPQAQVRRLEGCGHFLWEEAPEACLAGLRPFLEKTAVNHPVSLPCMEYRHVV